MSYVPIRTLAKTAIGFPLFGFLFAIIWSILFHFEASNRTVCHVWNVLPTISSAIGGFVPQRYVWRICISLQTGLRFLLAFCYYNWHLRVHMGANQRLYKNLVTLTVSLHCLENIALVVLTAVSSTDNADVHEYMFIMFMVCSQLYMILSWSLIHWTHVTGVVTKTQESSKWLYRKIFLQVFNIVSFLVAIAFYFHHNWYCQPYVYTVFAFFEYLTILTNIAFHGVSCVDFKDYSFAVLHTEDLRNGRFKNT